MKIFCQWVGCEKVARSGRSVSPIPEEITSELGRSNIVVHRSMRALAVTLYTLVIGMMKKLNWNVL